MNLVNLNIGKLKDAVRQQIANKLIQIGPSLVAYAQAYTPVDTGHLRASEGFTVVQSTLTLQLYADAPYAIHQEKIHHFLARAAAQIPTLLGLAANVQIAFPNTPSEYAGYSSDTVKVGKVKRVRQVIGRSQNRSPRRVR